VSEDPDKHWCKDMPVTEVIERLMAVVKAKNQTLQSLDRSLEFVYKVVTKERERLGPAGLDGHLNSIGGVVLQMRDWIKASLPNTPPTG
jgi:hypothetical protein